MKFRLFAVLHYMELDNVKTKGKRIKLGDYKGRITNSSEEFEKVLSNSIVYERIGWHSASEFTDNNATYIYLDGELKDNTNLDEIGVGLTFKLLREIEYFIHNLWAIKDNSVYVRDGFLIVYSKNSKNPIATYNASLSAVNSKSDTSREAINKFSDSEIDQALSFIEKDLFQFGPDNSEKISSEQLHFKYPTKGLFHKSEESTRYSRAFAFVVLARSSFILPLKIVSYVNALECLFTTSKAELNYRLSERIAFLLEEEFENRVKLFKTIKDAYNLRSTIVHGEHIKNDEEELIYFSNKLDKVLRTLLVEHKDFFEGSNDNQIDEKFERLVFKGY